MRELLVIVRENGKDVVLFRHLLTGSLPRISPSYFTVFSLPTEVFSPLNLSVMFEEKPKAVRVKYVLCRYKALLKLLS